MTVQDHILTFMIAAPAWTPVVFGAYALGRKQFGLGLLFALVTAEAVSLAAYLFAQFVIAIMYHPVSPSP